MVAADVAPGRAPRSDRIATVDSLRGVAVFAVVWFHLTNGNPLLQSPGWLRTSGRLGWLGVDIFFVISGFVIPHALYRADYRIRDCGRFLLRRAARLEPPYLVSIVLYIAVTLISSRLPGFRGQPPSYTLPQLLSHVPYLTGLLGFTWINIVYWSLALELQYYLLIGWSFPLIVHPNVWVRVVTVLAFDAVGFAVPSELIVLHWMPLFTLGVLVFLLRSGLLGVRWYVMHVVVAAACARAILGVEVAAVAGVTSLVIAFVELDAAPLLFLGTISYSLYLIHVPVGGRLVNAIVRFSPGPVLTAGLTVAIFGACVIAAHVFYVSVEKPAKDVAHRLRIARRQRIPEST
jgi:peptidoglycan/LPS O-acetylase OafA/YrhL